MLYLAVGGQAALTVWAYIWEVRSERGPGSGLRRAALWTVAWLAIGLLPTLIFGLFQDSAAATGYAAVYLIERSLSLDNVFVFVVLIAAFEIPAADHNRLVSIGSLVAFAVRAPAILVGVALFKAVHPISYAFGALLIVFAVQTARSGGAPHAPGRTLRLLQRRLPVSEPAGRRWIVRRPEGWAVTPMLMCVLALVLADVAFAVDSIPAGLAISHDQLLLLSANLFALLGLRPLYQLVVAARARLRFMNETISVLLGLVGLKLISEELVHVGPVASLVSVAGVLAIGAGLSVYAARREPVSAD
jgi:tellurite resistance protein TerC